MTMKKEMELLARRCKKQGVDPETIAPTNSTLLRKIFFAEYARYQPRQSRKCS